MGRKWRRVGPCLYRSGDTWRTRLAFRFNGRTRVLQATTNTETAAALALVRFRQEAGKLQRSLKRDGEQSTFGDWLDYYTARKSPQRAGCYIERNRELAAVRLSELADRYEPWWIALRGEMSDAACNRVLAYARAALNLAVRHGKIPANPLAKIQKHPETPRDVTLSRDELARLLNVARRRFPDLAPLWEFAALVPTRRGELLAARREDYDAVNNVIRLRAGTTKNRDGRYLPVPESLVNYFRSIPADCPWLFYRRQGGTKRNPTVRYLPIGSFQKAWAAALAEAGLPRVRFHDLRSCAATNLLAEGNDSRTVMALAGWRSDMLKVYWRRDNLTVAQTAKLPSLRGDVHGGVCTRETAAVVSA